MGMVGNGFPFVFANTSCKALLSSLFSQHLPSLFQWLETSQICNETSLNIRLNFVIPFLPV